MSYDIVIVGGGVVGLTLAALIANSNLKILLIDKNIYAKDLTAYDLRCSAINRHSCEIFAQLNLLDKILTHAKHGIFEQIDIYTDKQQLKFAAHEINLEYLGYILQNQAMINVLLDYLHNCTNITILAGSCEAIDARQNCIFLNQQAINYKLLVVADGRSSLLRQLLGVELNSYDYHDSALVAIVETAKPSLKIASQFFAPDSILAFLPLADERQFSIVLSQKSSANNQLMQASKQELGYVLSEKSKYTFGQIAVISQSASFDLLAQHAKNYVIAENIVLVGDSAHTIHPLAGQGLNLGLADVAILAKLINKHKLAYRQLRQYERAAKLQNSIFMHSMSALRGFFKTTWPANTAMQILTAAPSIKTAVIKSAVYGMSGVKETT
jgi:2-octaprenylphenol hydroxylase